MENQKELEKRRWVTFDPQSLSEKEPANLPRDLLNIFETAWLNAFGKLRLCWADVLLRRYILLSETRSLFGRSKILLDNNGYLDCGTEWEKLSNGCFVVSTRIRARNADIRKMFSSRPWARVGDLELFLAGWEAGEKSCSSVARTEDSYNQELESNRTFSTPASILHGVENFV